MPKYLANQSSVTKSTLSSGTGAKKGSPSATPLSSGARRTANGNSRHSPASQVSLYMEMTRFLSALVCFVLWEGFRIVEGIELGTLL